MRALTCIAYLWSVWAHLRGDSASAVCVPTGACVTSAEISDNFRQAGADEVCIFQELMRDTPCSVHSALSVFRAKSIPHSQQWAYCEDCSFDGDRFAVYSNASDRWSDVDLSWTQWHDYFYPLRNDYFQASVCVEGVLESAVGYLVERPVFIVPLITVHVGHILIDALEQVYSAMIRRYGTVRYDSVIVIDVSNGDERGILESKLHALVHRSSDSPYVLLRLLTAVPLMTMETFRSIRSFGAGVLFRHLHVGLDVSRNHFNSGHLSHPFTASVCSSETLLQKAVGYRAFQTFVNDKIVVSSGDSLGIDVVVVQRKSNRRFNNLEDLLAGLRSCLGGAFTVSAVDLEDLSFAQQVRLFRSARIVVSAAGTALHNMLFMTRRPSAVVIVMQVGWCSWSWMYANQALFLGIRPFVYCDPSDEEVESMNFARAGWTEGPRVSKLADISVSVSRLSELLPSVLAHVQSTAEEEEDCRGGGSSISSSISSDWMVFPESSSDTGTVSAASKRPAHPEWSMSALFEPMRTVELFISALNVDHLNDGLMTFKATLEIEISAHLKYYSEQFLPSLPYLSFCATILRRPKIGQAFEVNAGCAQIELMGFYSTSNFNSRSKSHSIHYWLQMSPSGGKIRGSDTYIHLSADGGVLDGPRMARALSRQRRRRRYLVVLSAAPLQYEIKEFECCEWISGGALSSSSSGGLPLQYYKDFQRSSRVFCERNGFSPSACLLSLEPLSRAVLFDPEEAARCFQPVQAMPSATSPFVFLHIEKTAGTSLRR
jgi:hypothetical protein